MEVKNVSSSRENPIQAIILDSGWGWNKVSHSDKEFTADAVIEAYYIGKKHAKMETEQALLKKVKSNLRLASRDLQKIISVLHSNGFHPRNAFLKFETADSPNVLITIPEEEFLTDNFRKMYSVVRRHLADVAAENYHPSFSFLDFNGNNLNVQKIKSDGYYFNYSIVSSESGSGNTQ